MVFLLMILITSDEFSSCRTHQGADPPALSDQAARVFSQATASDFSQNIKLNGSSAAQSAFFPSVVM